jgi:hypothetical protein
MSIVLFAKSFVDTWSYTRFEADPVSRNVTIQYIDDGGTVIDSNVISLDIVG